MTNALEVKITALENPLLQEQELKLGMPGSEGLQRQEKLHTEIKQKLAILGERRDFSDELRNLPLPLQILFCGTLLLEAMVLSWHQILVQNETHQNRIRLGSADGLRYTFGAGGQLVELLYSLTYLNSLRSDLRKSNDVTDQKINKLRLFTALWMIVAFSCAVASTALSNLAYARIDARLTRFPIALKSLVWVCHSIIFTASIIALGLGINTILRMIFEGRSQSSDVEKQKNWGDHPKLAKSLLALGIGLIGSFVLPILKRRTEIAMIQRGMRPAFIALVSAIFTVLVIVLGLSCIFARVVAPIIRDKIENRIDRSYLRTTILRVRNNTTSFEHVEYIDGYLDSQGKFLTIGAAILFVLTSATLAGSALIFDRSGLLSHSNFKTPILHLILALALICNIIGGGLIQKFAIHSLEPKHLNPECKTNETSSLEKTKIFAECLIGVAAVGIIGLVVSIAILDLKRVTQGVEFLRQPLMLLLLLPILSMMLSVGCVIYSKAKTMKEVDTSIQNVETVDGKLSLSLSVAVSAVPEKEKAL